MLPKFPFSFVAFAALAALLQPLEACNVPVFRYALERWPAELFNVVIFYRDTLDPAQKTLAESLEEASRSRFANLDVITADLSSRLDPMLQQVWEIQTNATLPWTVVLPPHGDEAPTPLWKGRLDSNVVAQLVDSPLRREIAGRLLRGDSAVWLFLESGGKGRDDSLAEMISRELAAQEKQIALPPPDPEDPRMHASLPLRVAFSVLRASRNDPAEALFVKTLLHGEARTNAGPVVFPIFGRGRALAALSGQELTAKVIREAASFVCGACSCEVKELNPGKDLLLAANWNSIFTAAPEATATLPPPIIRTNAAAPPAPILAFETHVFISKRTILGASILIAAALVVITGTILFRKGERK